MCSVHGEIKHGTESRRDLPNIARWVQEYGWIEIGQDDMSQSFVRALDEGGLVWEGQEDYATLDAALQDLENGLAAWIREQGL